MFSNICTDVLRFDNSYSWVNNTTLFYETELIEPDQDAMMHGQMVDGGVPEGERRSVLINNTHL